MVKNFLFFSDFGREYLRVWPICNCQFKMKMRKIGGLTKEGVWGIVNFKGS